MLRRRDLLDWQTFRALALLIHSCSHFGGVQTGTALDASEDADTPHSLRESLTLARQNLAAIETIAELLLACPNSQQSSVTPLPTASTAKEQP